MWRETWLCTMNSFSLSVSSASSSTLSRRVFQYFSFQGQPPHLLTLLQKDMYFLIPGDICFSLSQHNEMRCILPQGLSESIPCVSPASAASHSTERRVLCWIFSFVVVFLARTGLLQVAYIETLHFCCLERGEGWD